MHKMIFILLFLSTKAFAQYKITLTITQIDKAVIENLYFASNINSWTPNDANYKFLKNNNNSFQLHFTTKEKNIQYKITAGSWTAVEKDANNNDIDNRTILLSSDTTLFIQVKKMGSTTITQQSTASKQVVLDSIWFPSLQKFKKLWIYLPKGYHAKKAYNSLYMHDGQNLFDKATAFSDEWGIDEFLDTTANSLIVIGIANDPAERLTEYSVHKNKYVTNPKGTLYIKDLVKKLLPYIQKKYSTTTTADATHIAGSSMGANISLYATLQYPKTFGKVGLFSPAFWINKDEINKAILQSKLSSATKFYLYAGAKESDSLIAETKAVQGAIYKTTHQVPYFKIRDNGKHNENFWQQEFKRFYKWLVK